MTELYLDIEKTRFADRLTVDIQVADAAKFRMVPSMILQPLVENSLKHAIAALRERRAHSYRGVGARIGFWRTAPQG